MTTNAAPLAAGMGLKNCSRASNPPADAPMPIMGGVVLVLASALSVGVDSASLRGGMLGFGLIGDFGIINLTGFRQGIKPFGASYTILPDFLFATVPTAAGIAARVFYKALNSQTCLET